MAGWRSPRAPSLVFRGTCIYNLFLEPPADSGRLRLLYDQADYTMSGFEKRQIGAQILSGALGGLLGGGRFCSLSSWQDARFLADNFLEDLIGRLDGVAGALGAADGVVIHGEMVTRGHAKMSFGRRALWRYKKDPGVDRKKLDRK